MNTNEIKARVDELIEMEALLEETKALVEELRASLKEEMNIRNLETLDIGDHIIRYVDIISNRFDSTGFKKAFPETYKAWTKAIPSKRFTIS